MIEVVGIRFKKAGKMYYFDPDGQKLERGGFAIVETARGIEYGAVIKENTFVPEETIVPPLKKVLRPATAEDAKVVEANAKKEEEAFRICLQKIARLELDMKLVDVEMTFDKNKLIFYFTSDGRVDFRELVKELAAVFRMRIELRQIGVRDEAKMLSGIGICGRALCCDTFLGDFQPVSIKMAKDQNLALNPTKISGICGRLMCCLKNEEETYEYLNSKLPNIGDYVTTDDGFRGEVASVNVLRQIVKVIVTLEKDEKEIREYKVDQLKFRPKRRKEKLNLSPEEFKELAKLEKDHETVF